MDSDTVQDFETRKDGLFSFTADVGNDGLCLTSAHGVDYQASGNAQIVLDREQVLRLFEALHKHLGES